MKRQLIQYQGGGYSGCIWEWNYCLLIDGTFHDLFSSGRMGIKDKESLETLMADRAEDDDYCVYDLDKPKDLKALSEINCVHLAGLVKKINEIFECDLCETGPVYAVCRDCGQEIHDYDDIFLEDWHGCGGIMSTAEAVICQECHAIGTCDRCGDYDSAGVRRNPDNEDEYLCQYCGEWESEQD